MARRENSQRRRPPARRSRPLILVVCGAKRTESQYFTGLRDSLDSRAVDIVITHHAKAPGQVVTYARDYAQRSTKDFDEVWCVVDVDEFELREAEADARRCGIELSVSNPCFEVWLLLHHVDCRAALARCAAARDRMKRHVPGYDKTKLDFACFAGGVTDAVARAKALEPTGANWAKNPSTSVWRLVEKMTE